MTDHQQDQGACNWVHYARWENWGPLAQTLWHRGGFCSVLRHRVQARGAAWAETGWDWTNWLREPALSQAAHWTPSRRWQTEGRKPGWHPSWSVPPTRCTTLKSPSSSFSTRLLHALPLLPAYNHQTIQSKTHHECNVFVYFILLYFVCFWCYIVLYFWFFSKQILFGLMSQNESIINAFPSKCNACSSCLRAIRCLLLLHPKFCVLHSIGGTDCASRKAYFVLKWAALRFSSLQHLALQTTRWQCITPPAREAPQGRDQ